VKHIRHRLFGAVAGAALVGSLLTGFSASAPQAGAAGTINIGFICSCTGPLASSVAITKPAFQTWQKWVNANGGIDGQHVNVIYEDDASNPGTSLSEVETLISSDHVVAISDAGEDQAWATYAQQHGVPVIGQGTSQIFLTNSDFYAVGETIDEYFINFVDAGKKVGVTKEAELYCAESPICQQAVAPFKATAAKTGMDLAYVAEISASAPNFTAQCLAAKQAGVGALVIADAVAVVQSVMASCAQQGYTPYEVSLDGAVSSSFVKSPALSNSLVGSEPDVPFFNTTLPAMKTYEAALKKYEPSVLTNPNYGEEVTQTWIEGLLMAAAYNAGKSGSGTATAAEITKGLHALHGDTLGGMTPPLTFKAGQPNPVHCWFWIRTQHGKFTTPYGTSATCVTPPPLS